MTTRQARHNAKVRKARRDAGLCACGCGPSETYWHPRHRAERTQAQARRRERILLRQ